MLQNCKNILKDSLLSSDQRNGKKKLGTTDQEVLTCHRGFPVANHTSEKGLSIFQAFSYCFQEKNRTWQHSAGNQSFQAVSEATGNK